MIRIVLAVILAVAAAAAPSFAADVLPVHRLSSTLAGEAVMAAIANCQTASAVVVDYDGVAQAALRGDISAIQHPEAAFDKAYTAVAEGMDTGLLLERERAGTLPPILKRPLTNLIVAQGGLVIKVGDEVIGAIGVSGGRGGGDADERCARAGLDRIRDRLK
jgi:uncharacterized protein GlcG (DUF336 family)